MGDGVLDGTVSKEIVNGKVKIKSNPMLHLLWTHSTISNKKYLYDLS